MGGVLILGKRAGSVFPYQVYPFHQTGAHLFNLRVKGNDAALIRCLVVLLSLVLWDVRGPLREAWSTDRVRRGLSLGVHLSVVPNLKMTDDLVLLASSNCHLLLLEGFEVAWEGAR